VRSTQISRNRAEESSGGDGELSQVSLNFNVVNSITNTFLDNYDNTNKNFFTNNKILNENNSTNNSFCTNNLLDRNSTNNFPIANNSFNNNDAFYTNSNSSTNNILPNVYDCDNMKNLIESNKKVGSSGGFGHAGMERNSGATQHGGFLNCVYTNATSLGNKINELEARLIQMGRPHLVGVAETWFSKSSAPQLSGYVLYQKDREGRGGGVCIYVRNDLDSMEVIDLQLRKDLVEQIWCGIKIGSDRILAGCIYRKPDSNELSNREILESLKAAKNLVVKGAFKSMVVAGDFNMPEISWNEEGVGHTDKCSESKEAEFIDALEDNFLTQVINTNTYQKGEGHCGSLLDLIITDAEERIIDWNLMPPLGNSEFGHAVIAWKYAIEERFSVEGSRRKRLNVRRGDYLGMNEELNNIEWENVFEGKGVNECYNIFLSIYEGASNKFIPVFKEMSRKEAKWMTPDIKDQIKLKHATWYRKKAKSSPETTKEYNGISRLLKLNIEKAKEEYEVNLSQMAKSDPKAIYSYVRSKQAVKENVRALKDKNGELVTERCQIAEILNKQFKSVFVLEPNPTEQELPEFKSRTNAKFDVSQLLSDISVEEKLTMLKRLDSNKSQGADEVNPHVLKMNVTSLARPLEIIFKRSV
jgi:hypothetical protein